MHPQQGAAHHHTALHRYADCLPGVAQSVVHVEDRPALSSAGSLLLSGGLHRLRHAAQANLHPQRFPAAHSAACRLSRLRAHLHGEQLQRLRHAALPPGLLLCHLQAQSAAALTLGHLPLQGDGRAAHPLAGCPLPLSGGLPAALQRGPLRRVLRLSQLLFLSGPHQRHLQSLPPFQRLFPGAQPHWCRLRFPAVHPAWAVATVVQRGAAGRRLLHLLRGVIRLFGGHHHLQRLDGGQAHCAEDGRRPVGAGRGHGGHLHLQRWQQPGARPHHAPPGD